MEIRKATLADFEQIKGLKLEAKASEARYNTSLRPLRDNRESYFSYLRNDLTSEDRSVLIATEDGEPVGIITGQIHTTLPIRVLRKQGHISNLFVASGHRGKGVATSLVGELLRWFREKGIRDVRLEVYRGNAPALKAFRKLGFEEYLTGFRKDL